MKTYKSHLEDILLDRQKSLLPVTQDAAATELLTRKLKAVKKTYAPESRRLRDEDNTLEIQMRQKRKLKEKDEEFVALNERRNAIKIKRAELRVLRKAITERRLDPDTGTITEVIGDHKLPPVPKRRDFVQPCRASECRGFLTTHWKCKLCEKQTCSKCGELQEDEDHECDKDILASFQLIRKESRPCPHCGAPITKISGCDHMFCVDCKTSFSWRTGEIHPKGNTNPYYWQWVEKNGKQVPPIREGDDLCGSAALVEHLLVILSKIDCPILLLLLSELTHLEVTVLGRLRRQADEEDRFQELRVKYLLKDIDEPSWKVQIQRTEKRQRKARFIADIFELFVRGSIDLLRGINGAAEISETQEQIVALKDLCNKELDKISEIFNSEVYHITPEFRLRTVGRAPME